MSLLEVSRKQWTKLQEVKLASFPSFPQSLRVIRQELLCCCGYAGIIIYDSDLQQQRTIPSGDMGGLYDLAEMSNGDLVAAARNGLYHFNSTGK